MAAKFIKNNIALFLSLGIVLFAIIISLFNHWEMGGETWGYWFFARVFAETGKFIILDRSPLYVLYLNAFQWMGYPTSVTIEYLVTTAITSFALVFFLKKYIGLGWATFAAVLWIPFLQMSEPPVQKLALACSLFAVIARQKGNSRFHYMSSYAFLGFAYMFRMTYIILIPLFWVYDLIKSVKNKKHISWRPNMFSDWPVIATLGLLIWFSIMQSPHPWNNAWPGTTKWFPFNGKSLSRASFIQVMNWSYIGEKYGSFTDRDFYFTNQELFGGKSDILGAIMQAPKFVAKQFQWNSKVLFYMPIGQLSEFRFLYPNMPSFKHSYIAYYGFFWFCTLLMFSIILWGAFKTVKGDKLIVLFLVGNVLLITSTIFSMPKLRYMFPFVPILPLSAYWVALQISKIWGRINQRLILSAMLILFSTGITSWLTIGNHLFNDIRHKDVRILESRPYSMKASFARLDNIVQDKRGIMSLENAFIGAFMNVPIKNVYDIWEIPPFDRLEKSNYNGLTPKRVDCVLISREFATGIGYATNYQMRYQNYLKPYAQKLTAKGAKRQVIPQYGSAVFFSNTYLGVY